MSKISYSNTSNGIINALEEQKKNWVDLNSHPKYFAKINKIDNLQVYKETKNV